MLSPPVSTTSSTPSHDHARIVRRISTPYAVPAKERDITLKNRPRSGSWAGSTSKHHQITVNFSTTRSKTHFLSHFTKHYATNERYTRSLSKLLTHKDVGFVYNPSERSANTYKRKKGPLSGISNFFRRLRQNTDPVYTKEVHTVKTPISTRHTKKVEHDIEAKRDISLAKTHLLHSVSPDPLESEPPHERSKRESLQAHLRYFGLDLNSFSPSADMAATGWQMRLPHSKSIDDFHPKSRADISRSSSARADNCIREEPEVEAAKSSVSLSRTSCNTCESMYNTYTTYRQSQYSVTEFAAHDESQNCNGEPANAENHLQDDNNSDDDDDEPFVDATATQSDPPLECRADQLTKRLSGGHFGSAGGLVLSVSDFLARPLPPQAKRHSTCCLNTFKKDDTITSYRGDRRRSQASAHTVVGVILSSVDEQLSSTDSSFVTSQHEVQDQPTHCERNNIITAQQKVSIEIIPDANDRDEEFMDPEESEEEKSKLAARRIWVEDSSFQENMDRVAEWLGSSKPFNQRTLKFYMEYFDFRDLRLDIAFRKLCRKLPLNAESQQIDRILENFAIRYWECNPKGPFGNADVVYAIVYSLLLLNTDLHIAQGEHRKMSRSAFTRNTMCAIRAQVDIFIDLTTLDTTSNGVKRTPSARSYRSTKSTRSEFSSTGSTTAVMSVVGCKQWYSDIEVMLKDMYMAVKNSQILQPSTSLPDSAQNTSPLFDNNSVGRLSFNPVNVNPLRRGLTRHSLRERSGSLDLYQNGRQSMNQLSIRSQSPNSNRSRCASVASLQSATSHGSSTIMEPVSATTYQSIANLITNTQLPATYTSDAPFYKEGVIIGKHLLEKADQKAKHREWKEYFCIVYRAELLIHRLDYRGIDRKLIQKLSNSSSTSLNAYDSVNGKASYLAIGGGDLMSQAQQIGCIDLKHSLSTALPSGYSRQRPHAFALQQAHGGVHVFQVGSDEQLVAWISTLNYWAARESKEPLLGGVSNMEFGWGDCLLDVIGTPDHYMLRKGAKPVGVHDWKPPVPPEISSSFSEMDQFKSLQKHVQQLNLELDLHREVKSKISIRFPPRTTGNIRALTNWEAKAQYLLHEIIKYQNYCDAIEKCLTLQVQATASVEK